MNFKNFGSTGQQSSATSFVAQHSPEHCRARQSSLWGRQTKCLYLMVALDISLVLAVARGGKPAARVTSSSRIRWVGPVEARLLSLSADDSKTPSRRTDFGNGISFSSRSTAKRLRS